MDIKLNMKIAILTDSAAVIDEQLHQQANIKILQIPILLDNKTYKPSDLPAVDEVAALKEATLCTVTEEQIPLSDINACVSTLATAGYTDVICIHITNSISGLGSNLKTFTENNHLPIKLHLFDSHSLGQAQGVLVKKADTLIKRGLNVSEVLQELTNCRQQLHTLLIMEDLKNLRRTGSISNGSHHYNNSLLPQKTVLHFSRAGELEVLSSSSRNKKIAHSIVEKLHKYLPTDDFEKQLSIMADSTVLLEKYSSYIHAKLPELTLTTDLCTPTIFTFTGPKATLISWHE